MIELLVSNFGVSRKILFKDLWIKLYSFKKKVVSVDNLSLIKIEG